VVVVAQEALQGREGFWVKGGHTDWGEVVFVLGVFGEAAPAGVV
jgi:hypothetical protein